jgi:Uma2 family endonuclease
MVMAPATKSWTRADVLALPDDGNRYELVDRDLLVTPAPRLMHQRAVWELFRRLDPYVRSSGFGAVMLSPADLDLGVEALVQPDLFVAGLRDGREPIEWDEVGIPLFAVEVLSPSSARHDRVTKRRLYQRTGVPLYWIVDLDARLIEAWTPTDDQPTVCDVEAVWHAPKAREPWRLDVPAYFTAVHGSDPPAGSG